MNLYTYNIAGAHYALAKTPFGLFLGRGRSAQEAIQQAISLIISKINL